MNQFQATTRVQDGKAVTTKETFSRQTSISIAIQAAPSIIWALLTNASDFSRWNSTVVSIEGEIYGGNTIRLKSTLDEKRTFKLKVNIIEPERKMVWGDGKGSRTYTIHPQPDGRVLFSMTEKIGGLMFPLYAKYIPPFDEAFEQFAADLKKESEIIQQSND